MKSQNVLRKIILLCTRCNRAALVLTLWWPLMPRLSLIVESWTLTYEKLSMLFCFLWRPALMVDGGSHCDSLEPLNSVLTLYYLKPEMFPAWFQTSFDQIRYCSAYFMLSDRFWVLLLYKMVVNWNNKKVKILHLIQYLKIKGVISFPQNTSLGWTSFFPLVNRILFSEQLFYSGYLYVILKLVWAQSLKSDKNRLYL